MASPFFLLERFPPARRLMEDQYAKRARQISKRVSPHIKKSEKIIDIGSGTGFVAKTLAAEASAKVTLVDVFHHPLSKLLPVVIYDGKTLPFQDRSFDTSLLIAALHHCQDPMRVLDEAIRVSSRKVIVMEDLFESEIEKWLTLFEDSVVNWEFRGHPHNNRNEEEWLKVFRRRNLKLLHLDKFRLVCAGFPFRLGIFVLEKKSRR